MASSSFLLALSLLAAPAESDPRIEIVEQQLALQYEAALERTEQVIARQPDLADSLWLRYLQGHLLEALGRREEAHGAFADLLADESDLAAYARLRMALLQDAMGHPEVAAGLVATLLGRGAPTDAVKSAVDLLTSALERGADCRLLGRLPAWPVGDAEHRRLRLAQARCARRGGDASQAAEIFLDMLLEGTTDLVARQAALELSALPDALRGTADEQLLIGMAFHYNREFDRSTSYLARGLGALDPEQPVHSAEELFGYRYAEARGHFWLRRYPQAAAHFLELAEVAPEAELTADSLYQAGRSQELAGQWTQAATTFRRAYLVDRAGDWAGAALLSAMRIEFRTGREAPAMELFAVLSSRPAWQGLARRAALFLAASDLVRGRSDRAVDWLRRTPGDAAEEFLYWRGRAAELDGGPELAIRHYLEILRRSPHHPLADAARERLANDALRPLLDRVARALAASGRRNDLHSAWLLYGEESLEGAAIRARLEESLRRDARAEPYLSLALLQPAQWPLWSRPLSRPGERFLALGVWQRGEPYVLRHFPVNQPSLAFTGSAALSQAGMVNRSLHLAEIMALRVPGWVPPALLPESYRRLLYPFPYRESIERASARFGIEPALLAALIREESRFDPQAVSAASARGLTQFVYSTALEMAPRLGLRDLRPEQLNDPEISIALGAAYVAYLLEQLDGRLEAAVTAYNAGEEQTRVWNSYCYSREPAEYYSKVGFPQTRGYLRKVTSSRNQYRELYAAD